MTSGKVNKYLRGLHNKLRTVIIFNRQQCSKLMYICYSSSQWTNLVPTIILVTFNKLGFQSYVQLHLICWNQNSFSRKYLLEFSCDRLQTSLISTVQSNPQILTEVFNWKSSHLSYFRSTIQCQGTLTENFTFTLHNVTEQTCCKNMSPYQLFCTF